jgi:hypothetical protein
MKWFKYALIRYMPDPIRGEIVNIGIVVFNDTLDIYLLKSASKLRMLDNDSSQQIMQSVHTSLLKIYELSPDVDSFCSLVSTLPGGIKLSSLATFSVDHLSQYNVKVTNLFEKLVKPYASKESKTVHNTRLITQLKRKFKSIELLAKDVSELSEHKIVSNYVLNESTGISADFLLKNGKFHLTEVIDYDVADTKAKYKETAMKLMTFAEGEKTLDGEVSSYFVYSASAKTERDVIQQINLAESYSSKIFNIASRQDYASYFQLIESAVGRSLPLSH